MAVVAFLFKYAPCLYSTHLAFFPVYEFAESTFALLTVIRKCRAVFALSFFCRRELAFVIVL